MPKTLPLFRAKSLLSAFLWLYFGAFTTVVAAEVDFLRLMRLSPAEGLSEGHVNTVLIDHDGFLWLATKGGLDRYDGYEVNRIKGPDDIFDGSAIPYIFQDSTGLMWISHGNTGLYTLDLSTRKYVKRLDENMLGKPDEVVKVDHIVEQDNGNLWLSSTQNLRLFHREIGRMEVVFSVSKLARELDAIRRLLLVEEHLYIATTYGLWVLNINTRQYKKIDHTSYDKTNETQNDAKELYFENNQLWVGTVEGLYSVDVSNIQAVIDGAFYWNPKTSAFKAIYRKKFGINQLSDNLTWSLLQTKDGDLWAGSINGLNRIDLASGSVSSYLISDDKKAIYTGGTIFTIMEAQSGDLWLVGLAFGFKRQW
jgi:ligand-binding sensor domain-containing protein